MIGAWTSTPPKSRRLPSALQGRMDLDKMEALPRRRVAVSSASDELWYKYNLPISDKAHPDYSADMPMSFADSSGLDALKLFMGSSLSHENSRLAKSELESWDEAKWKQLQAELVSGVSKLQMVRMPGFTSQPGIDEFHPGKGKPIEGGGHLVPARVLSFINVRVYRSEEGGANDEGRYLVVEGAQSGGWKLINAQARVGEKPPEVALATLSQTLGAVESGDEKSVSTISLFELMDVLAWAGDVYTAVVNLKRLGKGSGKAPKGAHRREGTSCLWRPDCSSACLSPGLQLPSCSAAFLNSSPL